MQPIEAPSPSFGPGARLMNSARRQPVGRSRARRKLTEAMTVFSRDRPLCGEPRANGIPLHLLGLRTLIEAVSASGRRCPAQANAKPIEAATSSGRKVGFVVRHSADAGVDAAGISGLHRAGRTRGKARCRTRRGDRAEHTGSSWRPQRILRDCDVIALAQLQHGPAPSMFRRRTVSRC